MWTALLTHFVCCWRKPLLRRGSCECNIPCTSCHLPNLLTDNKGNSTLAKIPQSRLENTAPLCHNQTNTIATTRGSSATTSQLFEPDAISTLAQATVARCDLSQNGSSKEGIEERMMMMMIKKCVDHGRHDANRGVRIWHHDAKLIHMWICAALSFGVGRLATCTHNLRKA